MISRDEARRAAAAVAAAAFAMGRARVRSGVAWTAAGVLLWAALHGSGIHATIAGVILGLAIPAGPPATRGEAAGEEDAAAARLERTLHPWVAFGVMPLFALASSGVQLSAVDPAGLGGRVTIGTAVALSLGKQLGIFTFTTISAAAGIARLRAGATRAKLLGASIVAGIGFTVALVIAALAYPDAPRLLDEAKVGILAGSLVSGVVGALVLRATPAVAPEARADDAEDAVTEGRA